MRSTASRCSSIRGEHVFHFETSRFPPVEEHVVVHAGEKTRVLTVQFGSPPKPDASPPPKTPETVAPAQTSGGIKPAAWVFSAIGVAAFGVEAYFGITGLNDRSTLETGCGTSHTCSDSSVSSVRTKFTIADVSLGVGVVSAVVATYFFLSSHGSHEATPPAGSAVSHFDLGPLPGGGIARVGLRF